MIYTFQPRLEWSDECNNNLVHTRNIVNKLKKKKRYINLVKIAWTHILSRNVFILSEIHLSFFWFLSFNIYIIDREIVIAKTGKQNDCWQLSGIFSTRRWISNFKTSFDLLFTTSQSCKSRGSRESLDTPLNLAAKSRTWVLKCINVPRPSTPAIKQYWLWQ